MSESIFPFISPINVETNDTGTPDRLCEYAYDFANNCLLKNTDNQNYFVYENEALRIWVFKALRSARYNFQAYSVDFGNEMFNLIGKAIDIDVMKLEIKRYITEALMFSPYIQSLSNFNISSVKGKILINFDIESIYGEMNYNDEWKEGDV